MTRGSWVRLGIQQTPWVDFEEGIYRYRFQGTVFAERIPLPTVMTSSDAGVSFHYNFPSNYGELHFGLFNGENYQRVETNDQKGFEFRGSLRPFATGLPVLRGLRAHLVYYNDHYVADAERDRIMGNVTYEHQYVNAGFDYLDANDQTLPTVASVNGKGYSVWATPRKPFANGASWEALLRYDHWTPNTASALAPASTSPLPGTTIFGAQKQNRTIAGVAYWFPIRAMSALRFSSTTTGRASRTSPPRQARGGRSTGCSISERSPSMKTTDKMLATLAGLALLVAAVAAQRVQINGAGATFPTPIYTKWFDEY